MNELRELQARLGTSEYRMSDDEIGDGECRNCHATFWTLQEGHDHRCALPIAPRETLVVRKEDLDRRWVCNVTRSGYHNGAHCTPRDPHDAKYWHCGYRHELMISLTDDQMKKVFG